MQKRQEASSEPARAPAVAWSLVLVFAVYGILISHDHFALKSGRATPTQSDAVFYMVRKGMPAPGDPVFKLHWYMPMPPIVQPQYFVAASDVEGLDETTYPVTDYETWLPPFHRQLKVEKLEDSAAFWRA